MGGSSWRWWGPLVLYMMSIYVMSARPVPESLSGTPDKPMHLAAYLGLALLAVRALARGLLRPAGTRTIAWGVLLAVAYGASDEWHQSFVPGRDASFADLGADALGALLAGVGLYVVWTRLSRRPSRPRQREALEEREFSHD